MPTYSIKHPTTGKTLDITGDTMPTEQELDDIFKQTENGIPNVPKEKASDKFPITGTVVGGAIGALGGPIGVPLGAAAGAGLETLGRQIYDQVKGNTPKATNMKEAFGQGMSNVSQTAGNQMLAGGAAELITAPFLFGKQLQQGKEMAVNKSVQSGKVYSRDKIFDVAEKNLTNTKNTGLLDKISQKVSNAKTQFGTAPKNAADLIEWRKGFRDLGWNDKGEIAGKTGEVARAIYRAINTQMDSQDKMIRLIDGIQSTAINTPKAIGKVATGVGVGYGLYQLLKNIAK